MRDINLIARFNRSLKRLKGNPGKIIFCSDYKKAYRYIERYIKKHYGKNASTGGINDIFGYFTNDEKEWFKIIPVSKSTIIPEWNEVWIDKTLNKEIIKNKILPRAKGKYKIHWVR